MFYTYVEKQGGGFFGCWQTRQVAFDTLRRYLYYSEAVRNELPVVHSHTPEAADATTTTDDNRSSGNVAAEPAHTGRVTPSSASLECAVSEVTVPPASLTWRRKLKVTGVLPLATRPEFSAEHCLNERDFYQLEIEGESRPMARGETPPAGPLLCPAAGLSQHERSRCNWSNDAYIRDPFFLKELFDSLRDQFEYLEAERARAAAAAADSGDGAADLTSNSVVGVGVQTLVSPRGPKGELLHQGVVVPVRLIFRSRDEREFRRFWYVLQSVLGYDKLIVRPYRGLPPYDPRNGVAFAHIPMSVWHTFHSLDKAVFYTFMRGNVYTLGEASSCGTASSTAAFHESSMPGSFASTPKLKRILKGAYLCVTHDSVLCMRDTGSIPRWLRLAEVQEFHWNLVARDAATNMLAPFCVFISDEPIPDLFFEPLPPAHGTDAIAAYTPLVDVRRLACVIHDSCFASLSTRRVIRMREVRDASMESYVARTVQEGQRRPVLERGAGHNSTLSCPLPKEQLATVWQQVQAELLERGNMANRAAIPIYASNARDVELSEDQLSAVERALDDTRERRDDIVGMPLERARQLERQGRAAAAVVTRANRLRQRHRDDTVGAHRDPAPVLVRASAAREGTSAATPSTATTVARVAPLTMELLQTPQIQGHFARGTADGQAVQASQSDEGDASSAQSKSCSESTVVASEYSSYLVPGARYISQEEWQSGAYATAYSALSADRAADVPRHSAAAVGADESAASTNKTAIAAASPPYAEERTLNEIIGRSMAALEESRTDLHHLDP
ncbi:hypothetical protein conserved [Leishmania donovani]|uniref:Uncharacterized protein n=3 Tax=Leishmania donovani species complex TaxID=38574 RepID=A4I760_LEIIN|nr:hypothetical protein, unknown function [Leishmania infantum JPCM5]TPP41363.1 hypothetical protein CGC20_2865 [Leishmania donovani]CAC9520998.1 hypothetical_protein_-_conserved [Leishmania infantum]CAJ1991460.1 hypothetical protein conserved [Leishmania donovani]CAM70639.1 hypothetical protein, unknown function [Leishmania infantum JPCM5]SUZ44490.1 hypothetical_protein_-_conserved [Leishmania infantum]|eukprot:XP_001467579.1 hypothetical protein, unknown function [Leishmania infantum JPCM5]